MSILDSVKNLAAKAVDVAKEAAVDAKQLAEGVVDSAKASYQEGGIQSVINKAGAELADVKTQVVGIATKAADSAKAAYNEQGGVTGMFEKATHEVSEAAHNAMDAAKVKATELKDVAETTFDKASSEISDVAHKAKVAATDAAHDLKTAATDAAHDLKVAASDVVDKVTGDDETTPKA